MGRRAQIALAAALGFVFVLAAAAYAIDRTNSDKIADGVRVGGISIGGLSTDQARHRLQQRLVAPLDKPVTVSFEGKKYVLSPDKLQLHADIDGMLDSALDASRSGGFPTRVWRYATGGSVDREIAPQIAYSSRRSTASSTRSGDRSIAPPRTRRSPRPLRRSTPSPRGMASPCSPAT